MGGWERACGDLVVDWYKGNLEPIRARALAFEAVEDNPWPLVFREMDAAFPDAKFILTTRVTAEKWLDSVRPAMRSIADPRAARRKRGPRARPAAYSAAALHGGAVAHLSLGWRAARVSSRRRRGASVGA